MKKIVIGMLLALICTLSVFASEVKVTLDGKQLEFEQPAVIVEERTLVPLRGIFEALGANVYWDGETKTVTSVKDDVTIKFIIGTPYLFKNDTVVTLDVPAQIMGEGYTMVPVRAISESFGIDVGWNDETKTVVLKNKVEGAILYCADAENPEDNQGLYGSGSKMSIVKDPLVEDNNVYFLDATVDNRASWTYIWVDKQFEAGCTYYVEYDVMLGDNVFGDKITKGTIGTCFSFADAGQTSRKDHGVGGTSFTSQGVWQRVSLLYTVPEDAETDVSSKFGIYAGPIQTEGIDHLVAIDFYVDNITVVPAENMPERNISAEEAKNAYFYGTTTKNPLEYAPGETMTFKLIVKNGVDTVKVPYVYYSCIGDDGKTSSGYVQPSDDGYFYVDTKCEKDGFVRVIVKACDENKRALATLKPFEGGAGVNIDKIKSDTVEPDDYFEFWEKLKKTAFALDNEVIYEKDVSTKANFVAKDVRLKTAQGAGDYASFIITYPKDASPSSLKLKMIFQGYGVARANPSYNDGYITVSMNAHDIPNDLLPAEYENLKNTKYKSYGWINSENQKPETSYWWKMYVRNMQVYNYATHLPMFDGKHAEFSGSSQGGFQACNMAAHADLAVYCYMNVPWFGNIYGNKISARQQGWYPDPMDGLRYFDTTVAAKHVKCKSEISAGLGDYTCPPSAIMAIYNNLDCEKTLNFIQNRTHSYTAPLYYDYTLTSK